MSAVYLCDGGCGTMTDKLDSFETFGIAIERSYCDKCAESISKWSEHRDQIHENAAKQFAKELSVLSSAWRQSYPAGKLPDE